MPVLRYLDEPLRLYTLYSGYAVTLRGAAYPQVLCLCLLTGRCLASPVSPLSARTHSFMPGLVPAESLVPSRVESNACTQGVFRPARALSESLHRCSVESDMLRHGRKSMTSEEQSISEQIHCQFSSECRRWITGAVRLLDRQETFQNIKWINM